MNCSYSERNASIETSSPELANLSLNDVDLLQSAGDVPACICADCTELVYDFHRSGKSRARTERMSGLVRRGKRMVMGECDTVRPLGVRYCDQGRVEINTVEMRPGLPASNARRQKAVQICSGQRSRIRSASLITTTSRALTVSKMVPSFQMK